MKIPACILKSNMTILYLQSQFLQKLPNPAFGLKSQAPKI